MPHLPRSLALASFITLFAASGSALAADGAASPASEPTVVQKVGNTVERGASAAERGIKKGVSVAASGVKRAASAAEHGASVAGNAIERTARRIGLPASGASSPK